MMLLFTGLQQVKKVQWSRDKMHLVSNSVSAGVILFEMSDRYSRMQTVVLFRHVMRRNRLLHLIALDKRKRSSSFPSPALCRLLGIYGAKRKRAFLSKV